MSLSDEDTQGTEGRAECLLARLPLPREFAGAPSVRGKSAGQGRAGRSGRDQALLCCGHAAAGGAAVLAASGVVGAEPFRWRGWMSSPMQAVRGRQQSMIETSSVQTSRLGQGRLDAPFLSEKQHRDGGNLHNGLQPAVPC